MASIQTFTRRGRIHLNRIALRQLAQPADTLSQFNMEMAILHFTIGLSSFIQWQKQQMGSRNAPFLFAVNLHYGRKTKRTGD